MEEPFNPLQKVELAMLRAEHENRFRTQIALLKERVGEGTIYGNDVVQVVVSGSGAYFELIDLPEVFGGSVGENVERHFLQEVDAIGKLNQCVATLSMANTENTRHISVLVLYSRRGLVDRKNCYVFEYRPDVFLADRRPLEIGGIQPGVMPLFYKLKIDADFAEAAIGMQRGMVFCMANAGDRHLLIRAPLTGDQVHDLNDLNSGSTVQ